MFQQNAAVALSVITFCPLQGLSFLHENHVDLSLTRWYIEVIHTKKRFELVIITVQIIIPIISSNPSLDAHLVKGAYTSILWDLVRVPWMMRESCNR